MTGLLDENLQEPVDTQLRRGSFVHRSPVFPDFGRDGHRLKLKLPE